MSIASYIHFAQRGPAPRTIEVTRGVSQQALLHGFRNCRDIEQAGAMRAVLRVIAVWLGGQFAYIDADGQVLSRFGEQFTPSVDAWLDGLQLSFGGEPRQVLLTLCHRFAGAPQSPTHNLIADQRDLIRNVAELAALGTWAAGGSKSQAAQLAEFLLTIIRDPQERTLARDGAFFAHAFLKPCDGNPLATIPQVYP